MAGETGCNCFYVDVYIQQQDLDNATSNTFPILNNTVYVYYVDCDGNSAEQTYSSPGSYLLDICARNNEPISVVYYLGNVSQDGLSSYEFTETNCCPITPTPTPTLTATPTLTPTQTITPTQTPTITLTQTSNCDATYCQTNCCTYYLTNSSGALRSWGYTDCDFNPQSGIYANGDSIFFCTSDPNSILIDVGCTLTLVGCCSVTPDPTLLPLYTQTPTATPTLTQTPTLTPTSTNTPTPTSTPTLTPTPTNTPIPALCENSSFDVCILLDESSSVRPSGFSALTQACVSLVTNLQDQLSYSFPGYQFGLVTFGVTVENLLDLTDDYDDIIDALTGNTYGNQPGTFLNLGLQGAYENLTGSTNTRNVDKKIIIYTDGSPSNTALAKAKADQIKAELYNGIYRTEILVVAIDTTTNTYNWLRDNIASSPAQSFSAESFSTLSQLTEAILVQLCQPLLTPTPTPTLTSTPTNTPTLTSTPTLTPTLTATPTLTPTTPSIFQFQNCDDGSHIFRFFGAIPNLPIDTTYYIDGGLDFVGCATVVDYTGEGILYDALGVTFTQVTNCGVSICPRTPRESALLVKCSDRSVFYATVDQDTAFVGAVYVYEDECYEFVEFSGPGGEYLGSPDYDNCQFCDAEPTPTPQPTATVTPTLTQTPLPCPDNYFCINTILPSLSGYSGTYAYSGIYNGYGYYQLFGVGFIYYTGEFWCLSNTLGGSCLLEGANPCESACPDISANDFFSGPCPTPTPTPIDCNLFDFNAYFDCDWEPSPSPTLTIGCDLVDFTFDSTPTTPTPTPSSTNLCAGCEVDFEIIVLGPTPTPTPTLTSTPPEVVNIGGDVTFTMMEEQFNCVSVKVLLDCNSGDELYVSENLIFDGTPIVQGITFMASINGSVRCLFYSRDDSNFSSNSNIDEIFSLYGNCDSCILPQTPTPTPSSSPTQTPTPTPTPTITRTPNLVYVFESCSPVGDTPFIQLTQVIQNQPVSFVTTPQQVFKDSASNCWRFLGEFNISYSPPPGLNVITHNGNYFIGAQTTIYPSCDSCQQITI